MPLQLPAHLQGRAKGGFLADALLEKLGSGQAPPHISIRGNRFHIVDAAGNETPVSTLHLDVVIVDANKHVSKLYREDKKWDPDNPSPPDCWSDNGVAPSIQASKPQSPTCATCKHNERGSAISQMSGAPIKACEDRIKLAVLVVGDEKNALYQLQITPGSLGAFRKYLIALKGYGVDAYMIHTRLEFEGTGMLKFAPSGEFVSEKLLPVIDHIREAGTAQEIVGGTDKPRDMALPPPVPSPFGTVEQPQIAAPQVMQHAPQVMQHAPQVMQQPAQKRGPGRPKKQEATAEELPNPFHKPVAQPMTLSESGQAVKLPNGAFGMGGVVENPATPDDKVGSMLDDIFNLPT